MGDPKLVHSDSNYAIIDDLLPQDVFWSFWQYFNQLSFQNCSHEQWLKVWKLSDGVVYRSPTFYNSKAPFGNLMDLLQQRVTWLAPNFKDLIGQQEKDWDEIQFTPYLYPAGTKISWHNDIGYTGACIFYAHPQWSAHWGGELQIAKTNNEEYVSSDSFSREEHSSFLNSYGFGTYIVPKPNRLVFTKGSCWHSINRVDSTAGDHVRCSVVGFFTKKNS
jgi:Rps23 Pro-64 3,4-dihydroxylase Tpa1-like proline 4-hydroxylase